MRQSLATVPVLAAIASAALAGCGSSSNYPASADNVCKTYNAKIQKLKKPSSVSDVPTYLTTVAPIFHQAAAKLQGIKAPSDKAAAYQRYISVIQEEAAALDRARGAKNAAQAIASIEAVQQSLPTQERLQAKAAGLKRCAQ